MDNINSVFLIKSPLQLLNAMEAKYHFTLKDNNCLLLIIADRKSQGQILDLIEKDNIWGKVILLRNYFPFSRLQASKVNTLRVAGSILSIFFKSSFFNIWKLNKIKTELKNVDRVFLGDYTNKYMRHFANSLDHKDIYVLDDGNKTIVIANQRSGNKLQSSDRSLKEKIKLFGKRNLQRLKDEEIDKLCFFTSYKINAGYGDCYINNDFRYIRARTDQLNKTENIYFIGSPLSETSIMDFDVYLNELKKVREYFHDRCFVYVAHRRELPVHLEMIREALNVEVRLFDYPIEYQLCVLGPLPDILASFISSALDNVRIIMGDKLTIISFRLERGKYKKEMVIDEIYDYYRRNAGDHFKLVNIDDFTESK